MRRPTPTQARPTQASTRAPPTALRTPGRARPAAADGGADARAVFEPPRAPDRHAGPLPGRRAPDPRAGVGDGQAAGRHDRRGDEGRAPDAAGAPVRRGGDDGGARLPLRTGPLRRQARLGRDHVHATVPAPRAPARARRARAPARRRAPPSPPCCAGASSSSARDARSRPPPSRRSWATRTTRPNPTPAGTFACRCRPAPRACRSSRRSTTPSCSRRRWRPSKSWR